MIRLASVSKNYTMPRSSKSEKGELVQALRSVSIDIRENEFLAVMGPSGCGKSTLLHLLGGLDHPTEGEVWIDQFAIHRMDEKALSLFRRQHVGVVFQFFNLLPQLTVMENVCLPLRLLNVPVAEAEHRGNILLEEVGLKGKADRFPQELSGGEQQRVAIVRALVHRPRVLLADEPTGNLDSATSETILSLLRDLHRAHQTTMVLVTHSQEVSRSAQRTITMHDGEIVGS